MMNIKEDVLVEARREHDISVLDRVLKGNSYNPISLDKRIEWFN